MRLSRVTLIMAPASIVAMAAQALMGLAMLQWFSPEATGQFAVIAQIAFLWATVALAQSPLALLANYGQPALSARSEVMRTSLRRWWMLAPLAAVVVCAAGLPHPLAAGAWVVALALCQGAWYIAQPWALRVAPPYQAALARTIPPVISLVMAAIVGRMNPDSGVPGLLASALCGYAFGSVWLFYRERSPHAALQPAAPAVAQADRRSTRLRTAHTVTDAVTGTALILVWQQLYGAADASYLAVALRLLAVFPVVLHAAWAQVLLARAQAPSVRWSCLAGVIGAAACAVAGCVAWWYVEVGHAPAAWSGLAPYLGPLVLWQACACMFAALSYRPFQNGHERHYSLGAMALNVVQVCLLILPAAVPWTLSPLAHLWLLTGMCSLGLLALAAWMGSLKLK